MIRDVVAIVIVVALFAIAGWLLPRCSLDLTPQPVPTTTTTDYRDVPRR